MRKKIKIAASIALALGMSSAANATLYDISNVLNGSSSGFGYSGFHFAGDTGVGSGIDNDNNLMTGTELLDIPAGTTTGSYDSDTGDFIVSVETNGMMAAPLSLPGLIDYFVEGFTLSGDLDFGNDGFLSSNSLLDITFDLHGLDPNDTFTFSTQFDFGAGQQCCSSSTAPNSFDNNLISLWGVNYTPGVDLSSLGLGSDVDLSELIGLDLRLELTPSAVPVPAAVWLFGSGLIGLAGVARRKA